MFSAVGGEEILALKKHNISYSIVPGISSAIAVPELAGIPVTHRKTSRGFHVITGHTAEDLIPENIKKYASTDETLVILMGLNNLSKIAETLILNGKDKKYSGGSYLPTERLLSRKQLEAT